MKHLDYYLKADLVYICGFQKIKQTMTLTYFLQKSKKDLGFSARTYDNAIAELKKNNYLVYQGKEGVNLIYYFYDKPYPPQNCSNNPF